MLLALAGCAGWVERIGVVAPDEQVVGVKLLRPWVTGRACANSFLGFPLGRGRPDLDEAVAALLARDGEVRSIALDIGLAAGALGWKPWTSLEEGLKATLEWARSAE